MANRTITLKEIEGVKRRQDDFALRMKQTGTRRVSIWLPESLVIPLRQFGEAIRLGGLSVEDAALILTSAANSVDLDELKQKWSDLASAKYREANDEGRTGAPRIPEAKLVRMKTLREQGMAVKKVCEEVGVSMGTYYKYFPAK